MPGTQFHKDSIKSFSPRGRALLVWNGSPLNLLCLQMKKIALIYRLRSFCFLNSNIEIKTKTTNLGRKATVTAKELNFNLPC